ARDWWEKAAAAGNAAAMTSVGWLYSDGQGVPQDYAKARDWWEKAAAAGNAAAMTSIGWLYAKGQGVPQDYAKARDWHETEAAARGTRTRQTPQRRPHAKGRGVPRASARARDWQEKAAAAGNAAAMTSIGWLMPRARAYFRTTPRRVSGSKRRLTPAISEP